MKRFDYATIGDKIEEKYPMRNKLWEWTHKFSNGEVTTDYDKVRAIWEKDPKSMILGFDYYVRYVCVNWGPNPEWWETIEKDYHSGDLLDCWDRPLKWGEYIMMDIIHNTNGVKTYNFIEMITTVEGKAVRFRVYPIFWL